MEKKIEERTAENKLYLSSSSTLDRETYAMMVLAKLQTPHLLSARGTLM